MQEYEANVAVWKNNQLLDYSGQCLLIAQKQANFHQSSGQYLPIIVQLHVNKNSSAPLVRYSILKLTCLIHHYFQTPSPSRDILARQVKVITLNISTITKLIQTLTIHTLGDIYINLVMVIAEIFLSCHLAKIPLLGEGYLEIVALYSYSLQPIKLIFCMLITIAQSYLHCKFYTHRFIRLAATGVWIQNHPEIDSLLYTYVYSFCYKYLYQLLHTLYTSNCHQ